MADFDKYLDLETCDCMSRIEDYLSTKLTRVPSDVYDVPKRCLFPVRVRNKKTSKLESVPCGRCLVCLSKQANDWYIRFQIEQRECKDSFFVTLTQNESSYEPLSVDLMQRYFKRIRSMGFKFKYVCLGEYGPRTARAHYHILFFLDSGDSVAFLDAVDAQWRSRGFVTVERPTRNHMYYIAKYNSKLFLKNVTFRLTSRRPAIGLRFSSNSPSAQLMDKYILEGERTFVNSDDGLTYAIPRFYRKKADDCLYSFKDKPESLEMFQHPNTIVSEYERYYAEYARAYNSFCQRKL